MFNVTTRVILRCKNLKDLGFLQEEISRNVFSKAGKRKIRLKCFKKTNYPMFKEARTLNLDECKGEI